MTIFTVTLDPILACLGLTPSRLVLEMRTNLTQPWDVVTVNPGTEDTELEHLKDHVVTARFMRDGRYWDVPITHPVLIDAGPERLWPHAEMLALEHWGEAKRA